MNKYTQISKLKNNMYCKECPIIVKAGVLLKADNNFLVQCKFINLVNDDILSVKIKLLCYDIDNNQIDIVEYNYDNLSIQKGESFADRMAIIIKNDLIRSFDIVIEEVIFVNNNVQKWVNKNNNKCESIGDLVEINEVLIHDSDLENYKLLYGEEAKYKYFDYEDLWICTCGNINKKKDEECLFCKNKKEIFVNYNLEKLETEIKINKVDNDIEQNENVQQKDFENKKSNKFPFLIIFLIMAIVGVIYIVLSQYKDGVIIENDREYYYKNNKMQYGWQEIDGNWYFFSENDYQGNKWQSKGNMLKNEWIQYENEWYYFESDGKMARNRFLIQDDLCYYLDDSGKMVKNKSMEINGVKWEFDSNGNGIESSKKKNNSNQNSVNVTKEQLKLQNDKIHSSCPLLGEYLWKCVELKDEYLETGNTYLLGTIKNLAQIGMQICETYYNYPECQSICIVDYEAFKKYYRLGVYGVW